MHVSCWESARQHEFDYPSDKAKLPGHVALPDQHLARHEVHLPQLDHELVQKLQVAALEQLGVALNDVAVLVTSNLRGNAAEQ